MTAITGNQFKGLGSMLPEELNELIRQACENPGAAISIPNNLTRDISLAASADVSEKILAIRKTDRRMLFSFDR